MLLSLILLPLAFAAPSLNAKRQYRDGSGMATIYNVGDPGQNDGYEPGAVACSDRKYNDGEIFAAVGEADFGGGSACNRQVWIWNPERNSMSFATVVDSCTTCGPGHIDLSEALWNEVTGGAPPGEQNLEWGFYDGN